MGCPACAAKDDRIALLEAALAVGHELHWFDLALAYIECLNAYPKPPLWPITPESDWFYVERWKAVHGSPNAWYLANKATGRQLRKDEASAWERGLGGPTSTTRERIDVRGAVEDVSDQRQPG